MNTNVMNEFNCCCCLFERKINQFSDKMPVLNKKNRNQTKSLQDFDSLMSYFVSNKKKITEKFTFKFKTTLYF